MWIEEDHANFGPLHVHMFTPPTHTLTNTLIHSHTYSYTLTHIHTHTQKQWSLGINRLFMAVNGYKF